MKRTLLFLGLAALAAPMAFLAAETKSGFASVKYSQRLGLPGSHSPHSELPELPLELGFDQGRARVVSRQEDGRIFSWDLRTGKGRLLAKTDSLFGYCRAEELLMFSQGEEIRLIDLGGGAERRVATGSYDHVAWSRDCARFALADEDGETVELWRSEDLSRLATATTELPVRNGLALSADGRTLAAAEGRFHIASGHETQLEIFRLDESGALTRTALIEDPILGMWKMVFAQGRGSLFVGSQIAARSGLRAIAPETGLINWRQDGFESYWVRALAVSPDGRLLVSGDEKGQLRGWDSQTGTPLFRMQTGLVIQSLSFSEDGKKLAVALKDSTIGILEVARLTD